ncbi:puratrophin-1 [Xenentodon cancila]
MKMFRAVHSMDSESLDRCIQTALAAVYSPFEATSPTVLCQALSVVENYYRGDGLRYLIHFLLPAKKLLQNLQLDACLPFSGLLFRHEGWPLCIHDKVVVHLCPLDRRLLHPGDFYLLVSPAPPPQSRGASCRRSAASVPRLLLCSVPAVGRHVEQQEVSDAALRSLFSMAWLDSVNRERERRGAARLERCLLSTHGDIFRVPWEDLVYPQFISRTAPKVEKESSIKDGETMEKKLLPSPTKNDQSAVGSDDSEGEYVELSELPLPRFSPQKGSLTQSISLQHRSRVSAHTPTTTHTPQTINTHCAGTTRTHLDVPTDSSWPCVELSSHTLHCSRVIKENLNQDHRGPVLFTPFSTSAPPEEDRRSSCKVDQTGGTDPEGSPDVKACTEHGGGVENRGEVGGKDPRKDETIGEKGKRELAEMKPEVVVCEGKEKVEGEVKGETEELLEEEDEEGSEEGDGEEESENEGGEEVETGDSYSESMLLAQTEDYCSDNSTHGRPLEEPSIQTVHPVEFKTSLRVSTPTTDSLQTQPEDSYSENGSLETQFKCEESDSGQGKLEEQTAGEEERSCKEDDGGRSAEHQTEAVSRQPPPVHSEPSLGTGPTLTEPEHTATMPTVPAQFSQASQSRFFSVLLRSGAVCLPGTRDRGGRPLLTVSPSSSVWSDQDCNSAELLRLLLYYTSTLRKEVRASGLTVLVDARRTAPASTLFSALRLLQKDKPGSIHTVLILTNKDSAVHLDKPAATQVEVLSSLKSLQKHVELRQLPMEFGGTLRFNQSSWISFRTRLEQLSAQCEDVVVLLQKNISVLQSTTLPAAQDAELLLSRYKELMSVVLVDDRLVQLQQEGGASLSWLRREEASGASQEQRAAVEAVSFLYEQVDELLHRLVMLSNARTQELNFMVDFRNLEQGFSQVSTWLEEVGEVHLKTLEEPADSLELLNRKQQDFKDFCATAYEHCKRGEELLARLERWDNVPSADLHVYEHKVHSFWAQLQDFSQRVNSTGQNIERAVQLYRFLDQAYGWALDGMRHLAGISMEDCTLPEKCQDVIVSLEDYQHKHPPIPDRRFQDMKMEAGELRGERGLHQWSFAWSKCQETKKMFDRKMEAAFRTRDSTHRRRSDSTSSRSSISSRKTLSGLWSSRKTSSFSVEEDTSTSSPLTSPSSPTPQHTPLLQRLFRSSSSEESSDQVDMCSTSFTPSSSSSFFSSRRQQMRKTQSFDSPSTPDLSRYSQCPRALSEPARRGNTGVFIRGLEVSSTEAADRTLCPRTPGPRSLTTPGTPTADCRPRGSKLRHIVEEMVTTEREYVRSLHYIIRHYFPEMDREDLPQDLRGKRSIVFGNLEKLLDFHNQFFLRELEACWKHPLRVPHCFLRHQEQFGLYALYSKNKPKSDALLANHGHAFFRRKQLELGDKMDLSSYLLKPIQRMSKYALLLTDLMKEVGVSEEAELATLEAATNMVKFQLRHGNDLLAMDAILDCDVNLKEQGQLIRQDEFTVWSGRRKCQRRIFLFEELVLFSKPKKMEGGLDVFIYKHSFKTADVGLTESTGDNGLKFEIWFRRRTSKNQTFILQAPTAEVKHAWTGDVARILWTQATRNKEMRLKEMVSMGVGNKPFLDIQPSDAAISDRAVHYIMKSRGARTRASIAVSVFDHSHPFKRGAGTAEATMSGPSSSSLLGPLNLHMYSQSLPSSPTADSSFSSCIEEDEQEHETSSQPSMTTESSGSSSRCLSGSTGSDSGCVSSHLQEALPEESSAPNQPSSSSSSSTKLQLSSNLTSSKAAPVVSPATIV